MSRTRRSELPWTDRLLKASRHPLRAVVTVVAVSALVVSFADPAGFLATVLGSLAGIGAGELLGRTRTRLPLLLGALGTLLALVWGGASVMVGTTLVPALLGPGWTLHLSAFLTYGAVMFTFTAGLRTLAVRWPSWVAVELAAVAVAFAGAFAAHRHGAIARPLWLADTAWRWGFDPATALLAVGALLAAVLAVLLLVESDRRLSIAAVVGLPIAALLSIALVNPDALRARAEASELSRIMSEMGDPPKSSETEQPIDKSTGVGTTESPGDREKPEWVDKVAMSPEEIEAKREEARQQQEQQGEGGQQDKSKPVAVVILGDDYSPPSGGYYLRQEAHSQLQEGRLVPTTREDADRDVIGKFPSRPEPTREPPPLDDRVLVHGTVALIEEHPYPFGLETPVTFIPTANPNPARFQRAYAFESEAQDKPIEDLFGREAGDPSWSDDLRAYYTQIPDDPRYKELAEKLVADLNPEVRDDPLARALAVKVYLDTNMVYSTKHRHAGVPDPTADFLFGDMIGYCVHSAHSSVYLWRALGLPARVGTGYLVFEQDRKGSVLLVRNGDAHAWPELYLSGIGWVILDVTPSESLDEMPAPVDEDMARLLGEMARQKSTPKDTVTGDDGAFQRHVWGTLRITLESGLALFLVVHWLAKSWRRWRPQFARRGALPRVAYRTALDLLAEAGLVREHGETREQFARRVAEVVPSFAELTEWHVADRLRAPTAARGTDRPEYSHTAWGRALIEVRRELRRSTRWWRRLLGAVNPVSIYAAR